MYGENGTCEQKIEVMRNMLHQGTVISRDGPPNQVKVQVDHDLASGFGLGAWKPLGEDEDGIWCSADSLVMVLESISLMAVPTRWQWSLMSSSLLSMFDYKHRSDCMGRGITLSASCWRCSSNSVSSAHYSQCLLKP